MFIKLLMYFFGRPVPEKKSRIKKVPGTNKVGDHWSRHLLNPKVKQDPTSKGFCILLKTTG